jgi:hypothetical protein
MPRVRLRIGDDEIFDFDDLDGAPPPTSSCPSRRRRRCGAFYNLIDIRHASSSSSLLSIDRASNTPRSCCSRMERLELLFTGDAEQRSWRTMDKNEMIQPVDFLKVSHHGSDTGMPPVEILDKLLPMPAPSGVPGALPSRPSEHLPGRPR